MTDEFDQSVREARKYIILLRVIMVEGSVCNYLTFLLRVGCNTRSNLLSDYSWFKFRVFFLNWLPYQG